MQERGAITDVFFVHSPPATLICCMFSHSTSHTRVGITEACATHANTNKQNAHGKEEGRGEDSVRAQDVSCVFH